MMISHVKVMFHQELHQRHRELTLAHAGNDTTANENDTHIGSLLFGDSKKTGIDEKISLSIFSEARGSRRKKIFGVSAKEK
jgi:hypothetical protein